MSLNPLNTNIVSQNMTIIGKKRCSFVPYSLKLHILAKFAMIIIVLLYKSKEKYSYAMTMSN